MIFIVIFFNLAWAGLPLEITPLYNHGIIYEKLKDVRLEFGKWNLQATYELQSLVDEILLAENLVRTLDVSCKNLETSFGLDCLKITENMHQMIFDLQKYKIIINSVCNPTLRAKRQINFIGHIFKEITGVMDHDDSSRLDKDIQNLHNNEEVLKNQLQRQTIAIDTIFDTNNKTISGMQKQLSEFSNMITFYNKKSSDERAKNVVKNEIVAIIGEFSIIISHLYKKGDLFLTLMETGNIPLTPEMYNPKIFYDDLKKVQKVLPFGFVLPFDLNLKNIMKFYILSRVHSSIENCKIIMNVQFPISNNITYQAFKGSSIPMFRNQQFYITAFENDVILKSSNTTVGMTISYSKYMSCIEVHDYRVCPSFHILEDLSLAENCNVQIFFNYTANACRPQPINLFHQLWIQLNNENSWIFAVPNVTQLDVLINGKHKVVEISGIGKLTILKPCLVKSKEVILHFHPNDFMNVNFDDFKINFENLPMEVKFLDDKVPDTIKTNVITSTNEKQLFNEIVSLKHMNQNKVQLLNVELEKHTIGFWTIIFYIIMFSVLSYLVFRFYLCLKPKIGRKRNEQFEVRYNDNSNSTNTVLLTSHPQIESQEVEDRTQVDHTRKFYFAK